MSEVITQVGERLIGAYEGFKRGPLLICIGGMHGNEHAGIKALKLLFKMLEVEPITNENFEFKGRIIGLIGNLQAYKRNCRYIKYDLNRHLTNDNVDRVMASNIEDLEAEDLELRSLLSLIHDEIDEYNPDRVILLDLHTTTAWGGIFTLVTEDSDCVDLGIKLNVPVVADMLNGIHGTTMHYFCKQNFGINIIPITFESGQHKEPKSVNRAIAAIINCMRTIGCVNSHDVENIHDHLLIDYAKDLPKLVKMVYKHHINEGDDFEMFPGYKNFEKINKDQILAHDIHGVIRSPYDGLILMPLYQKQGNDGFFIVKEVTHYHEDN